MEAHVTCSPQMNDTPKESQPLKIAIVGGGPAGFFCAEALFRSEPAARVDMFEALPVPFGLVRYGVAPDHPEIKRVTKAFERTAQRPGFSFLGNVEIGRDLTVGELQSAYNAVVFAYGAPRHRNLEIPGEDLPGSFGADEIVGWYNGSPQHAGLEIDLSGKSVAIIGNGNVALDLARILAKNEKELASTDITSHALNALKTSKIEQIHVIGRRGPVQASFTSGELHELDHLAGFMPVTNAEDFDLDPASEAELNEIDVQRRRAYEVLHEFSAPRAQTKRGFIRFHFCKSPLEILGTSAVTGLRLHSNELIAEENYVKAVPSDLPPSDLQADIVIRSIGYVADSLEGMPFDERSGTAQNVDGRIQRDGMSVPGLYAAGWIQYGAKGLIGSSKKAAAQTAAMLLSDRDTLPVCEDDGPETIRKHLSKCGIQSVSWTDWKTIDAGECSAGGERGKPREKFTSVDAMLSRLTLQKLEQ